MRVEAALILAMCLARMAPAQDALSLDDALNLAKARNGTVRSAQFDLGSASARLGEARSAYFPTVIPNYTYTSARQQFQTTLGTPFIQQEGGSTLINTSWTVLDSGERDFTIRSSSRSLAAQRYTTRQTLRGVLFDVTQQYYDTLRAQELQHVADAQVSRAAEILKATDLRIKVGDAAKVERLQANADLLNAKVQALSARNQTTNAEATLKATIGFETERPLPPLKEDGEPTAPTVPDTLATLIAEGMANRPDLLSLRRSVEASRFSELRADREAGLTFNLTANYDQQVTPVNLQDRTFVLAFNYPLFDGGLRRETARDLRDDVYSQRALLTQAERSARAEIEAAYAAYRQNFERLEAAQAARDASRENYNAALDAQTAGANGLLDVLTAQVSLVTAESDYIQAVYDYKISDIKLRLVTGRRMPDE